MNDGADMQLQQPARVLATPGQLLSLALVVSALLYARLVWFDAVNGWRPVLTFLGILATLFAIYAMAACVVARADAGCGVLWIVLTGALLFRLILLPAGLPNDAGWPGLWDGLRMDLAGQAVVYEQFQLYDDDIWRYLWDGHVWAQGVNPYQYAPDDQRLDTLAGHSELWNVVRANIQFEDTPTIYPPLAQAVFRLSHMLRPGSVLVMKAVVVFFDMLAVLFLALALRQSGRPVTHVILYAWNPLVVKVFAGSGHVDAALVAAIAALAYCLGRRARMWAAISFALAILAKLSPLILAPFVLRRIGWRYALVVAGVVFAGYLPFLDAGAGLFAGFRQFAREWQFNAGPFMLARYLTGWTGAGPFAARALCGLLIIAMAVWLWRRDDGGADNFAQYAALTLGALLVLSPAVMPWYLTWILPPGILARQTVWLWFSALVCLAFLVMADETERPVVLALEYGALAVLLWRRRAETFSEQTKS
ncbi:MAG: glycosyltransferase 87 family protein [Blastocatellia bacterium]